MNTILAGNFGATFGTNGIIADDISGPVQSLGHNIIGTATGFTNLVSTDLVGVDPKLGPLEDNGGATLTHALLTGSPAIDAGGPTGEPFDQRGQPRTIDDPSVANLNGSDGTDIGAFEANPFLTLSDISLADQGLRVRFTTVSSKTYQLQYKTNLADSAWLDQPGLIPGTGGIVTVTNFDLRVLPLAFFRVAGQ
jgi:hypothetical protein